MNEETVTISRDEFRFLMNYLEKDVERIAIAVKNLTEPDPALTMIEQGLGYFYMTLTRKGLEQKG